MIEESGGAGCNIDQGHQNKEPRTENREELKNGGKVKRVNNEIEGKGGRKSVISLMK